MLRERDVSILSIVYGVAAIVCTRYPLVRSLGYESSLVFAILVSIAGGIAAISRIRRVYDEPSLDEAMASAGAVRATRGMYVRAVFPLLVPLVILLGNAFFVRNCAPLEGIAFFLLLPGVTALFSVSLSFFCVLHYRHPRFVYFLIMVVTIAYALAIGYFTPAIFSYNFFYGYFPGLTYDEGLRLTGTIVSFRLITLALTVVLYWFGTLLARSTTRSMTVVKKGLTLLRELWSPSQRGLMVITVVLSALLWMFRCDLGYESTSTYIQEQLGGTLHTPHFIIHYPAGTYEPDDLRKLGEEHEFRLSQIMTALSLTRVDTLESFIYPGPDTKLRLMGAGTTNIAKPWSRQVHVTRQGVQSTLYHELIHVVVGRFGWPVIHASPSTGLTEGIPMALEWSYGARGLHEYSAALMQLGMAPDMSLLLSPLGFMSQAPAVSYVMSGSFCRYLIDRYGIRQMMQVYGGSDWMTQYGRPVEILVHEWEEYLDGEDLDETDLMAADALFRDPPIFHKSCPRVAAERNKAASRAMSAGNYPAAESLYAVSYSENGGLDALSGRLNAALRNREFDTVVTVANRVSQADDHPGRYLTLSLLRGDAFWALGHREEAFDMYHELRDVYLTDAYSEAAAVRMICIQDSALHDGFLRYFLFTGQDSVRARILDSLMFIGSDRPILPFLRGRLALRMGRAVQAMTFFAQVTLGDEDPVLEALRLQSMGIASYEIEDYRHARNWFWMSLNYDDTEAAEQAVDEWIDRCERLQEQQAKLGGDGQ
jgi:tetratricopeptide (TPR) repeat protein